VLMSERPRQRFGLGTPLEEGQPADLAVFDLSREWTVDPSRFLSQGKYTPFDGDRLFAQCVLTLCGGEVAWQEK